MCLHLLFVCYLANNCVRCVFFASHVRISTLVAQKIASSLFFIQISHKKCRHAKSAVAHKKYIKHNPKNQKLCRFNQQIIL